MYFLLSAIIGYLLGSIPTAYLMLRKRGIDITAAGSGNVGAMNSYEVTNSKSTGWIVFTVDALKGLLSVIIPLLLFPNEFIYPALALVFAVTAHCFNPWLSFKGGRGLATALGGTLVIMPLIPAIWIVSWVLVFLVTKDILKGNVVAGILPILFSLAFPYVLFNYSYPSPGTVSIAVASSLFLLTIIFIKHIEPLNDILSNRKLKNVNDEKK